MKDVIIAQVTATKTERILHLFACATSLSEAKRLVEKRGYQLLPMVPDSLCFDGDRYLIPVIGENHDR